MHRISCSFRIDCLSKRRWSQSSLTFYLSLLVTRSDILEPVAAECEWRASDVRVCERESVNMRHVNWHGNSSLVSDPIVMQPHYAKPTASLQQWLMARQSHCLVLWKIMVALTPIDSATSTIIERDGSVKAGHRHQCWGGRDGPMSCTWLISNTNTLRGMLCFCG